LLREKLAVVPPHRGRQEYTSCSRVIYGMGFSGRGAQLSTLIRSALPTLLGRTDTNPLDGMACHAGTNYRTKDMVA
jgi:hypothetical protein